MTAKKNANVVYVATVDLKYEVMAVGRTEDEARQLAAREALKDLRYWAKPYKVDPEVNTVAKIIDYYGINVTKVPVGGVAHVGID